MFGSELEMIWGTREFTKFFLHLRYWRAALTTVLASPVLSRRTDYRSVRSDFRTIAGLRRPVSRPHHLPLHDHPDQGEMVRRDLRRDRLSVRPLSASGSGVAYRCSSRRHAVRLHLPERRPSHSRTCEAAMIDGIATACAGSSRSITTNDAENDDQEKRRWRN